jgi:biopolymer transport protein ExbD
MRSSALVLTAPRPDINVTPMVDVVLVLLIIFMVISPFVGVRFGVGLPVTAPATTRAPARHLVTVTLAADGSLAVNGASVPSGELPRRLGELFALGADRRVLFEAADGVSHRDAADAMDGIRIGGGTVSVSLDAEPR